MGRLSLVFLILLAVAGSWMFFNEVPLTDSLWPQGALHAVGTPARISQEAGRIRIATFNLDGFDVAKVARRDVLVAISHILARFDVIALQEIESAEHHLLPTLVDEVNRQSGGGYDFVIGPRVGRGDRQRQFGFIFNRRTVQLDRYATYTINDPDDLINHEPLVGCFRAAKVPTDQAFTFSLVNLRVDEEEAQREAALLPQIFASVRDDGRAEDDVILLGDFQGARSLPGMTWIVGEASWAEEFHDNLVMDSSATTEFTGRSGIFDVVRELNLDAEAASRISRHFPVWAEFTAVEGGVPGYVARRPDTPNAR